MRTSAASAPAWRASVVRPAATQSWYWRGRGEQVVAGDRQDRRGAAGLPATTRWPGDGLEAEQARKRRSPSPRSAASGWSCPGQAPRPPIDRAVARVDQVDVGVFRGRVVDLERVPARFGQLPAAPQPPLDTEMRSGEGAPPLHAAITPVDTASAAVSAARRTLAPIRYEFRSGRVPPGYSGRVPWPGPGDPLTKRSPAGNRRFATLPEDAIGEEGTPRPPRRQRQRKCVNKTGNDNRWPGS